ncbi:MAG: RNA polymerase sigma factor [Planctomycetota bacterium]
MAVKPEECLVEAAQNGDVGSFAALYERYYGAMVALAYSVLADIGLSEDAAQEAFVVACRDLPRLKSCDKFGAWLAGICRNVAKQLRKSEGRFAMAEESAPPEEGDKDYQDAVRRAVWGLRAEYREAIVLRYYDNLSYEQISSVLGISFGAVHGRLTRAKRKVGDYLKRHGFTGGNYGRS